MLSVDFSNNHLFPSASEKNLTCSPPRRNRQEKSVIFVSFGSSYIPQFWYVRTHKYGLLYGIFHVPVSRVYQTWNPWVRRCLLDSFLSRFPFLFSCFKDSSLAREWQVWWRKILKIDILILCLQLYINSFYSYLIYVYDKFLQL